MDEKNVSKPSLSALRELKAEDQDEIEKIMNEIHELQNEISASVVRETSEETSKTLETPEISQVPQASSPQASSPQASSPQASSPQSSLPEKFVEEEVVEDDAALKRAMPELHRKVLEDSQGTAMVMDQLMEELSEPEGKKPVEEFSGGRDPMMAKQEEQKSFDSGGEAAVSMTLHGKTRLNVKYEHAEKEVMIQFQDERIFIQLSDGTEFNFTLSPKNKKAQSLNSQPAKKVA